MEMVKNYQIKTLPFLVLLLFLIMALIPHVWMLSGSASVQSPQIKFKIQNNFSGFEIETNAATQSVYDILGTTNLLDIKLSTSNGKPFRIFFAQWSADDKNTLMVLRHTPDICWINAGWTFVEVGLPQIVYVDIPIEKKAHAKDGIGNNEANARIPFECRTYRSPDQRYTEAVIWCSVLGGYLLNSYGIEFHKQDTSKGPSQSEINRPSQYQVRNNHLSYILKNRIQKNANKQYVRFSMEYNNNNTNLIQELTKLVTKHFALY